MVQDSLRWCLRQNLLFPEVGGPTSNIKVFKDMPPRASRHPSYSTFGLAGMSVSGLKDIREKESVGGQPRKCSSGVSKARPALMANFLQGKMMMMILLPISVGKIFRVALVPSTETPGSIADVETAISNVLGSEKAFQHPRAWFPITVLLRGSHQGARNLQLHSYYKLMARLSKTDVPAQGPVLLCI